MDRTGTAGSQGLGGSGVVQGHGTGQSSHDANKEEGQELHIGLIVEIEMGNEF